MKKSIGLLNLTIAKLLFFFFAISFCKNIMAQQNSVDESLKLKSSIYKANILTYSSKEYIKGYLANLSDTELQLSSSPIYFSSNNKNNFSSTYNYDQLNSVIIQRKGVVGNSVLIGALTGFGAGALTGVYKLLHKANKENGPFVFGTDSPVSVIGFCGIIGAVGGSLIGAMIGILSQQTFIIGGNKNKYDYMRESFFNKLFHSSRNHYQRPYAPNL